MEKTDIETIKTLDRESLVDHYVNRGKSMADIAREFRCSRQTVYRLMKSFGIPVRDRSASQVVALKAGKFKQREKRRINERFFASDGWSPGMAWVLGLLFADGNLKKSKPEFRLNQRSPEGLQKVLNLMRSSHMISCKEKRSYGAGISGKIYSFSVWNRRMYNDLLDLGLLPAQPRDLTFPDVPSAYLSHFIRGLYDGDGSFYINRFDGVVTARYRCGSLPLITSVATILQENLEIPIRIHPAEKSDSYYFQVRRKIGALVSYLYRDAPETIYISEKYRHIYQIVPLP